MTQDKTERVRTINTLTTYMEENRRLARIVKGLFGKSEPAVPDSLRDWHDTVLPCIHKRVNAALAKLQEVIPDSRPVLISAVCEFGMVLRIYALDMGRDLLGLRVREEFTDTRGRSTTREDDYPAFLCPRYAFRRSLLQRYAFPIVIRDNEQHKEEADWQDFARKANEESAAMRKENRGPTAKTTPSMPAIWISRPDGVRVFISVYDVAKNESESVRLEPWFYPGEELRGQDERLVCMYYDILKTLRE